MNELILVKHSSVMMLRAYDSDRQHKSVLLACSFFRLEAVPLGQNRNDDGRAGLDPCKAKITTIQCQWLDSRAGKVAQALQSSHIHTVYITKIIPQDISRAERSIIIRWK